MIRDQGQELISILRIARQKKTAPAVAKSTQTPYPVTRPCRLPPIFPIPHLYFPCFRRKFYRMVKNCIVEAIFHLPCVL